MIKKYNIHLSILDLIAIILIGLYASLTIVIPINAEAAQLKLSTFSLILRQAWLLSPLICLYLLARVLRASSYLSLYLIGLLITGLYFINAQKTAITTMPLSFEDIVAINHLPLLSHYLSGWIIAIIIGIAFVGIFIARLKCISASRYYQISLFVGFLLTLPWVFSPYPWLNGFMQLKTIQSSTEKRYAINYTEWNLNLNLYHNGLPRHLIQTSLFRNNLSYSQKEAEEYHQLNEYEQKKFKVKSTPYKTVVYVLCESCWYNEEHFKTIFEPLEKHGLVPIRATSPLYGGGTPNAEFEFLTGLSAKTTVMSGVFFQGYAKYFAENMQSLPQKLRQQGFQTYAAHNNTATFFRRNEVYPKMGFARFDGLNDLPPLKENQLIDRTEQDAYPDDGLLFNAALNQVKEANGQKLFLNLVTMSTHGPYPSVDGDDGQAVYAHRLNRTVNRLTDFIEELHALDPNAFVVIYGDHKPFLGNFFTKLGIDSKSPALLYDVPLWLSAPLHNPEAINKFKKEAAHKQFFCVASLLDDYFIHSGLVSYAYNRINQCHEQPEWLYSLSLFKSNLSQINKE